MGTAPVSGLPVPAFLPLGLGGGHLQVAGVPRQAVLIWQQHAGGEKSRSRWEPEDQTQLPKPRLQLPAGSGPGEGVPSRSNRRHQDRG